MNEASGDGGTIIQAYAVSEQPDEDRATSLTLKLSQFVYLCVGFAVVEVPRSPNDQLKVKVPAGIVDVLLKTKLFPFRHWMLSLTENPVKGEG